MNTEVLGSFGFRYISVELNPGEEIITESDAMVSMDSGIELNVKLNGGILSAFDRAILGGESFFLNHFSNPSNQKKNLILTHALPGDIVELELKDESIFLQPGAFIAASPGVKFGLSWAGFQSFFAREGLFRLKCFGTGKLWFGSFGAIFTEQITEEYYVDSGHLVAYQPSLKIALGMAGGIASSIFSGEGIIAKLRGNGVVYIQSRSLGGMASWLNPHL